MEHVKQFAKQLSRFHAQVSSTGAPASPYKDLALARAKAIACSFAPNIPKLTLTKIEDYKYRRKIVFQLECMNH